MIRILGAPIETRVEEAHMSRMKMLMIAAQTKTVLPK